MAKLLSFCAMICCWIIFSLPQVEACSIGGRVLSDTLLPAGRPGVASVCFGRSATLYVRGETGSVLRWEYSDDSTSWRIAPGTARVLTTPAITARRWYRAVVKSGACPEVLANSIRLDLEPPAIPGTLVSDKKTYECRDSIRFSVSGFQGRVAGFTIHKPGYYRNTFYTTDSVFKLFAYDFGLWTMQAYALIVNTCGDTIETPEILFSLEKYKKPIITFKPFHDTICLHGGSIKIYLDNYDGRPLRWWHNLSGIDDLYNEFGIPNIYDNSTDISTVYASVRGISSYYMLPPFISQTGANEFTVDIKDWGDIMHKSWFWDTTRARFGQYPSLKIHANDDLNCYHTDSLVIPIHYPNRSVGGVVESDRVVCSGNSPGTLNLFGYIGRILRWESSTDAGITWASISHTSASYTPPALTRETWYRSVVDNSTCDGARSSEPAKITIATSAVGGTITGDSEVCFGEDNTLLTLSNHVGQIKHWEISYDDGATWTRYPHIAATLLLGPQTRSATYRAILNANGCSDVPSAGFKLNVIPEPVAVGGEVSARYDNICVHECADLKLNFHSGEVVHWEKSNNCEARNWTIIGHPNQTSISECGFVPTNCCDALPTTVCFRAMLRTDLRCRTAYSTEQRIIIDNRPCLDTNGAGGACSCTCNEPLCGGESTFILLKEHLGQVLYWEKAPTRDTTSWSTIANTTATQGTGPLSESTCFRAVVERGGVIYRSKPTCVEVNPAPRGGILSADRSSVCIGEDSGPMKVEKYVREVVAWLYSDDGEVTWKEIPGSIAKDQLRSLKLTKNTAFKVRIRSCATTDVYSNTVRITVTPGVESVGGFVSGNRTVCIGESANLVLTNNIGNVIRWESSTTEWETITTINSTNKLISTPAIATATQFRAVVQSGVCSSETSIDFRVTPSVSFPGTITAQHRAICSPSGSTELTLNNYIGDILHWESSTDFGATWTTIAATTASYTVSGITSTTLYRAKVQNGSCPVDSTFEETVSVASFTSSGRLTSDETVCMGIRQVSLYLSGTDGVVEYWERSIDGGSSWSKIHNVSYALNDYFNFKVNTLYRAVTNTPGCGTAVSNTITVTVIPAPEGGKVLGSRSVCGKSIKTDLTLSGYDGTIDRWEMRSASDNDWTAIAHTSDRLPVDISSGTEPVYYRAVVTKAGCTNTDYSTTAAIEFIPDAKEGILTGNQETCTGNLTLPIVYNDFVGTIRHWETSTDGVRWSPVAHRDSVWSSGRLPATTYLRVVNGNPACRLFTSNVVKVTVTTGASPGAIVASATCSNDPVMITATGASGRIFRWERSTDGGTTWRHFASSTPILRTPAHTSATTYRYWVFCGTDTLSGSPSSPITIQPAPTLGVLTANSALICPGTSVQFNLSSSSIWPVSLEYSPDCFATPGTGTMVSSFPHSLSPSLSGCYRVVARVGTCPTLASPTVRVDVSTAIVPLGVISGERTICSGFSGGVLRLTGHGGTIERWEASSDCAAFSSPTDLVNGGNANLAVGIVPSTSCFRAVLRTACGLQYSPTARITVHPVARVSARFVADGACGGGDARIEATATGGSGGYRFYLDPGVMSSNRTGIFVNPPAGIYNVNAQDIVTGCITNTVVTVDPPVGGATISSIAPTQTTALVRWTGSVGPTITYNVRYRVIGSSIWNTRTGITMTAVSLVGLQNGTRYEAQVEVMCPGGRSLGWSPRTEFLTQSDGSCMTTPIAKPGAVYISNLRPRAATLKWNPVAGARGYIIQTWIKGSSARTASTAAVCAPRDSFNFPGLVPGRTYVYRIQTSCNLCAAGARLGLSSWTSDQEFTTPSLREGEEDLAAIQPQELIIYPNPNNGSFYLQLASISDEPVQLQVYDLKGQLVAERQWTATSGEMQLPVELNEQASGIYLLQVSQGEFRWNTKLMID
jgi:hypothetical protein